MADDEKKKRATEKELAELKDYVTEMLEVMADNLKEKQTIEKEKQTIEKKKQATEKELAQLKQYVKDLLKKTVKDQLELYRYRQQYGPFKEDPLTQFTRMLSNIPEHFREEEEE